MDELTKNVLAKPSGPRTILTASDRVMKGWQVRQAAADYRAQETIGAMTARLLSENGCRVV